ncbi:hypothetical protein B005_0622 [Nocardiopsis alba ATCC BAA-2165]|uniref:Uncharacterized protein n=1 Tax=Nocardiopsis alba (strain ATCC BAA-2165 / BE74) TaxID=1205910 RepID=J7LBQ4_NOCAA|nr:hypothetical protein B005_0622 [Nocardiopsis alba ATCC BAA-2165]
MDSRATRAVMAGSSLGVLAPSAVGSPETSVWLTSVMEVHSGGTAPDSHRVPEATGKGSSL